MLITFGNNIDPDEAQQSVGPQIKISKLVDGNNKILQIFAENKIQSN